MSHQAVVYLLTPFHINTIYIKRNFFKHKKLLHFSEPTSVMFPKSFYCPCDRSWKTQVHCKYFYFQKTIFNICTYFHCSFEQRLHSESWEDTPAQISLYVEETRAISNSNKNHSYLIYIIWKMGRNLFSSLAIKNNLKVVLHFTAQFQCTSAVCLQCSLLNEQVL